MRFRAPVFERFLEPRQSRRATSSPVGVHVALSPAQGGERQRSRLERWSETRTASSLVGGVTSARRGAVALDLVPRRTRQAGLWQPGRATTRHRPRRVPRSMVAQRWAERRANRSLLSVLQQSSRQDEFRGQDREAWGNGSCRSSDTDSMPTTSGPRCASDRTLFVVGW